MTHRLRPFALPFLALLGCGSISDPSKNGEHTAVVTGALTGSSVPANARVALVWRTGTAGGLVVGADAPVIAGKFSMSLGEAADAYFVDADSEGVSDTVSAAPDTNVSPPSSSSSGSSGTGAPTPVPSGARVLRPMDAVSGGITNNLSAAFGGFVVYQDTNANGKLDIDDKLVTTDTVIGGNKDLMIVDLRGGGALDFEKLRDKAGILPVAGLNLMWSEGRWLGLDLVELKISATSRLPSEVCYGGVSYTTDEPSTPSGKPLVPTCSADGRSYSYVYDCPVYVPETPTLCNAGNVTETACGGTGSSTSLAPGEPVPSGWPCTVVDETDGGIDGGEFDASVDAGPAPDASP